MSLRNTITEYLRTKGEWVHKGELGRKAVLEWGFENENMGRRCRELENDGIIQRELRKNANTGVQEAWYRISNTTTKLYIHKPYCAKSIAINNETPFVVKCDCKKPEKVFCCREAWEGKTHNPKCYKLKVQPVEKEAQQSMF